MYGIEVTTPFGIHASRSEDGLLFPSHTLRNEEGIVLRNNATNTSEVLRRIVLRFIWPEVQWLHCVLCYWCSRVSWWPS